MSSLKTKVVITGAGGMLGQELCQAWSDDYEVVACDRSQLDVTDAGQVMKVLQEVAPDVIVHAAAYTKVDLAEQEHDLCYRVNVGGTRHVAEATRKIGAKMCYISTDYVFDGCAQSPYAEDSPTGPLNVYGQTKYKGELEVQELLDNYVIVRVSWLCGIYGPNFVKAILAKAQAGESLTVVNDQQGVPTFTRDVAVGLKNLLDKGSRGLYHMTSQGECSWFQFVQNILKQENLKVELNQAKTVLGARSAQRPMYSVMSINKLKAELGTEAMPHWQNSLEHMLKHLRS